MEIYKPNETWLSNQSDFDDALKRKRNILPILTKEEMNCQSRVDEVFIRIFQIETSKDTDYINNPIWSESHINLISKQLEILYTIISTANIEELPIEMIRDQNILEFIYDYFTFVICVHSKDPRYVSEISIGCSLLAVLLDKHVITPIEVANTPLIKTLRRLAVSTNEADQASSVDVFASMIQPGEEFPQILIEKFLPLAFTLHTTFPSLVAQKESLYFLREFIKHVRDIPIDAFVQINQEMSDILRSEKHSKLHSRAIEIIQRELLYYPMSYEMLIEAGLIPIINTFLQSNTDSCLHAANRVFSIIFTDHNMNADVLFPYLKYESIVENVGYEINQNIQKSTIYLIMDMVSRGSQFIEQLFRFDLVSLISDIFSESELSIKKLFIKLITNLLFCGDTEQLMQLITSKYFEHSITEIHIFTEIKPTVMFLDSVYSAIQKLEPAGHYYDVKQIILSATIADSLTELLDSSDIHISTAARMITDQISADTE